MRRRARPYPRPVFRRPAGAYVRRLTAPSGSEDGHYDLDREDDAWLAAINSHPNANASVVTAGSRGGQSVRRKGQSSPVSPTTAAAAAATAAAATTSAAVPLDNATLERAIFAFEREAYQGLARGRRPAEAGIEYQDDTVCDVCMLPDSAEGNEMVFCDGCNVCVHQNCYGIKHIPEGNWYCLPCRLGIQARCTLCPNMGGALKPTQDRRSWAHLSCGLWVPECTVADVHAMEPVVTSEVPSDRYDLLCTLCKTRGGACIQCEVPHCTTAFHVTCAIRHRLRMDYVEVKQPSAPGGYAIQRSSYCHRHRYWGLDESGVAERKRAEKQFAAGVETPLSPRLVSAASAGEFCDFVDLATVAESLGVPEEVARTAFAYWVLKRRRQRGKPLVRHFINKVPTGGGGGGASGGGTGAAGGGGDYAGAGTSAELTASVHSNAEATRAALVTARLALEKARSLCEMVRRRELRKHELIALKRREFVLSVSSMRAKMESSLAAAAATAASASEAGTVEREQGGKGGGTSAAITTSMMTAGAAATTETSEATTMTICSGLTGAENAVEDRSGAAAMPAAPESSLASCSDWGGIGLRGVVAVSGWGETASTRLFSSTHDSGGSAGGKGSGAAAGIAAAGDAGFAEDGGGGGGGGGGRRGSTLRATAIATAAASTLASATSDRAAMHEALEALCKDARCGPFLEPVDETIFTDYTSVIRTPMDLGTVALKLAAGAYDTHPRVFDADVVLVFKNCLNYNLPGSGIAEDARALRAAFRELRRKARKAAETEAAEAEAQATAEAAAAEMAAAAESNGSLPPRWSSRRTAAHNAQSRIESQSRSPRRANGGASAAPSPRRMVSNSPALRSTTTRRLTRRG